MPLAGGQRRRCAERLSGACRCGASPWRAGFAARGRAAAHDRREQHRAALQQWVVRVRAQACGLCAPRACLRCARTLRHRCTWPPCARLPARAVSSVCSCSFVVGPTSIVKALARLRRRRPPSRSVCRRLCGHALRDCTLCNCALCDCALRDRALCAQIATMLLRMFALCAPVLCVCWLRAFAPCALGRCVCAGICLCTPCCRASRLVRRHRSPRC